MYKNIRNIVITESEKNRILGLYKVNPNSDFLIKEWLSPDEKFVIFLDELYDIKNKKKIGNIWENIENFKFFIKHSFEVSKDIPKEIMESVQNSLNNLLLTESVKDYSDLKERLINEGLSDFFNNAGEWFKDTVKNGIQSSTDFVSKSFEGITKVVKGITSGEWTEVLNLLKKGSLWVMRKIRSALYNPIGLILDAILVATGIGKVSQSIVWGVVVGLDIYELSTGNYENKDENFLMRLLFTGVDIIAFVSAGGFAKSGKTLINSIFKKFGTKTDGLIKACKSNPAFKSMLENMMKTAEFTSTKMGETAKFLQNKSPMLYKFISGTLNNVGKIAKKIIDLVSTILGGVAKIITKPGKFIEKGLGGGKLGKGAKAGIETTAIVGGIGTYQKSKENEFYDELLNRNKNLELTYDSVEL
jgi:hypothetical protein